MLFSRYGSLAIVLAATIASTLPANEVESKAGPLVAHTASSEGLQLLDAQGGPWLQEAASGVRLVDGTLLCNRDQRYRAAIELQNGQTTVRMTDMQKQLDQTWTITALDDRCFTFVLTARNVGEEPLSLARIYPLLGTFVEKHDTARPHVLLNGTSMSKPLPTKFGAEAKAFESTETVALESPSVAAGFLTGKHNYNHFRVADHNGQPKLWAYGDCNGCLLMPGASRETDILFVSLHENPLEQLERYADLAGEINKAKIWPGRVAWCTWYAGWMHAKMDTYRNGLEKGVEESIPLVKKYFAQRGGLHTLRISRNTPIGLHGIRTAPSGSEYRRNRRRRSRQAASPR